MVDRRPAMNGIAPAAHPVLASPCVWQPGVSDAGTPIHLPRPLRAPLEAAMRDALAPPGLHFDFGSPAGEPALVPADSISWRIFKNPVAVTVGGIAAVLLELAEPRVRTGVWEFTSFRTDPMARMRRTGLAAMATVYGARSRTERLIAGVARAHAAVRGHTPDGRAFSANEPELLDWVYATAGFGFVRAYHAYVRALTIDEMDAAHAEGMPAARLYGAETAPGSVREMDALFDAMRPRLEPHPILFEYLAVLRRAPLLPGLLAPLQTMLLRAAVEIVPGWMRRIIGLDARYRLRPGEALLLRQAGRLADRIVVDSHPAVLASLRLGLPREHAYR